MAKIWITIYPPGSPEHPLLHAATEGWAWTVCRDGVKIRTDYELSEETAKEKAEAFADALMKPAKYSYIWAPDGRLP